MVKKSLIFFISLFLFSSVFAQEPLGVAMSQQQKEMLKRFQEENPRLAEYQKKILGLYEEMEIILKDYREGKITKRDTEEKLRVILHKQIEITSDREYMVEMTLFGILSQPLNNPVGKE
ncbi:MAG: hypothetical protein KKH93_05560 [Candidatus Omnitrophica bacterium]|nr:hypothetical protein [Candidatus Omnitrophota bacterium]MBU2044165.1 hypothetical protein [Candidatus Omnitrophota bacterium]